MNILYFFLNCFFLTEINVLLFKRNHGDCFIFIELSETNSKTVFSSWSTVSKATALKLIPHTLTAHLCQATDIQE